MAQVFSEVLGYGSTYEIFQFIYDLWLWTTIGSAKNSTQKHHTQIPLRLALLDLQRQLGDPALFFTIATYEWSLAHDKWIRDEAHTHQAQKRYMRHTASCRKSQAFSLESRQTNGARSAFYDMLQVNRRSSSIFFLSYRVPRWEKRKRQEGRAQHYHGRGSPHVHALLCLRRPRESTLLDNVSATESDLSTLMTCLLKKSLESYSGSGWQVQTEPNRWVESDDVLQLRHTQHDFDNGVRAYFPILMESLRCHMDLAMSDGRGMLLRYVAAYVPNLSFSFATDWLNDDASTSSVTRRILHDYHPLEPEMWLQLFNNNIPQCCQGRTMQRYIVPVAWQRDSEERAMQYCQCDWRNDDMTLWRFLRVTNRKGQAHRFVRQAAKEAGENDVTKFALNCESKGKVLIATVTMSSTINGWFFMFLFEMSTNCGLRELTLCTWPCVLRTDRSIGEI